MSLSNFESYNLKDIYLVAKVRYKNLTVDDFIDNSYINIDERDDDIGGDSFIGYQDA